MQFKSFLHRFQPLAIHPIGLVPPGSPSIAFHNDQQWIPVARRHVLHEEHGLEIRHHGHAEQHARGPPDEAEEGYGLLKLNLKT